MATTNNLALTLVEQSQSQKEITVNAAFARIDAILNRGVIDKDLSTPPGSPAAGDLYIVGPSATGNWTGYEEQLAYYDQVWRFLNPKEGMTVWINDENRLYTYNGSDWVVASGLIAAGSATLSSGSATVNTTLVTANSRIFLTPEGTSAGAVRISSRSAGASFTITSTDGSSADTVHWALVEMA